VIVFCGRLAPLKNCSMFLGGREDFAINFFNRADSRRTLVFELRTRVE
jgi:hypothetical protein